MNNREKLAILTAAQKVIKKQLEEIRPDVDEEVLKLGESAGVQRVRLDLFGQTVGAISIVTTKAASETVPYVESAEKAAAHISADHQSFSDLCKLRPEVLETIAKAWLETFGECLPGVGITQKVKPARNTTRVTVDHERVIEIVNSNALSATEILELPTHE